MEHYDLEVTPLTPEDSYALALKELPPGTKDAEVLARTIAGEADGRPLFIQALASSQGLFPQATFSFDELLDAHRRALPKEAAHLLEMTALLGRPVELRALLTASGAERSVVDQLQAGRLLRVARNSSGLELECYHDRIRESIAARLSSAMQADHYRSLATALSKSEDVDPELLTDCFEGSGQLASGARCAALAAARAERGMAFERAARLYQRALQLGPASEEERHDHLVSMGHALGNAGRASAAADAYLKAAALTTGSSAVELRRRAAFELLTGGYAEAGEALIREVCQQVGIRIPADHRSALAGYLIKQVGLRWKKIPPPAILLKPLSEEQDIRLKIAWTATFLSVDDPILGLWAGAQFLRMALSSKDPGHIARALTVEGFHTTMVTPHSEARISELYAASESYGRLVDDAGILGALKVNEGVGFMFGRAMSGAHGREYLRSGVEQLRTTRGNRVYVDSANMYLMVCPSKDLASEARRSTLLVEEAFSLKRLWAARHMTAMSVFTRMLVDDCDGMTQHLNQASAAWTPEGSAKWIDATMFQAHAVQAHYRGEPEATLQQAEKLWPIYEGSGVQKSFIGSALMHAHRGSAAVWVARLPSTSAPRRKALLRMARRDLKRVSSSVFHAYSAWELAIKTGLALAEGRQDQALAFLRRYIDSGKSSPLWAETEVLAAQRLTGLLIGGAQGEELVQCAESSLRDRGVREVAASCQMLLPGCHVATDC
jgi:tetratricopeptide (TPR) repeat protein